MKKNSVLTTSKRTYTGDILYDGRKEITFHDYKLNKTIKIDKKDLKQ